ncbi:MAG: V-type ATP synthase subunit D [Deltaproteobacteria bacterium]|jgi:V/A-type H+-transporting ATPase subunit D|nr:V-type ATP synthase subunit D [Deltaproteobacteria bacterium]
MSEKVKLNKNSLREQTQSLKLFQEFLPTLELRKQQLQIEVRDVKKEIQQARREKERLLEDVSSWKGKIAAFSSEIKDLISIDEVKTSTVNIAGVKVPQFDEIKFQEKPWSLIATPWIFDAAVDFIKKALSVIEKVKIIQKKQELLQKELTKTTQRINLYEKVLIPQAKENIKKIKVYLGDQQTAAVCRAKIAKNKIEAKAKKAAG